MLNIGDRIFFEKGGMFYIDRVADVLTTEEGTLYELVDNNWWVISDDYVLDESDERVRNVLCMSKNTMVKLSDVRHWLSYHARDYYEADAWSEFKSDEMIKDLCKAMLYEQSK